MFPVKNSCMKSEIPLLHTSLGVLYHIRKGEEDDTRKIANRGYCFFSTADVRNGVCC